MVADHYGLHDHRYVQGRCGTDINYLCCHLGLDIWQPAIHRNLIAHAHRGRHLRGILLQKACSLAHSHQADPLDSDRCDLHGMVWTQNR